MSARAILPLLACGLLAACSGLPSIGLGSSAAALHVEVQPGPGARPLQRAGQPLRVRLDEFVDARAVGGRRLGNLRATVRDMHGTELMLDRNVAALLTEAARAQFAADGLQQVGVDDKADVVMSGAIRTFSLDVAGRDERALAVEVTLRDAASDQVVWAGIISDQDDRYAGVSGNSRASITAYLAEGVTTFAGRLSGAVHEALLKGYPDSVEAAPAKVAPAQPGVTTLQPVAPPPAVVVAPAIASPPGAPTRATGIFSIWTNPPRAKVHVGDVYFGLTPLRFDLPVGIATLRVHLDGHRSVSEKVSIRAGETTELELALDKQ